MDDEVAPGADERARSILRRRYKLNSIGQPSDPRELQLLLKAYWISVSAGRKSLLECVRYRAFAAGARDGYQYQNAEDVLQDSLYKGAEHLTRQYMSNDPALFRWDPDKPMPLSGFVRAIIGEGHGERAGLLGTYLRRDQRESARFALTSSDENGSILVHMGQRAPVPLEELSHTTDDGTGSLQAKELLSRIALKVNALEGTKRFAVSAIVLIRSEIATGERFWGLIKELIASAWPIDTEYKRHLEAVSEYRSQNAGEIDEAYVIKLISFLVHRCETQVKRWYNSFLSDVVGQA